jgi:methionine biosynthesis protein MetW
MLPESVARLERTVPDSASVLDVGGWGSPLARADSVLDLMPYETRGLYGATDADAERFSAGTWVQRDMCAREPWPFDDDQFDFSVCSHTLEDVRDPIFVCSELVRVSKAGYIEVPSRLEEQSHGFQGPWTGWGHHHWLIDVGERSIDFVFKHHVLHGRDSDHFPPGFRDALTPEQRVQSLWWEGSFDYTERVLMSAEEVDSYLGDFVAAHRHLFPDGGGHGRLGRVGRRLLGAARGS